MKKKVWIVLTIILGVLTVALILLLSPKYWIATENTYVPYDGAPDIYQASKEELMAIDLADYSETFGPVKTKKEAYRIAAKVILEVYGSHEYPYIVQFNQNANAWIVHGSTPLFHMGGVASIAIDKESGEILMLIHTK